MKKNLITLLLVMLTVVTFGQQWVAIKSDAPSTIQKTLVASSESSITVNLQVPGFYAMEVNTPRGEANLISVPKTVTTAQAGEPNLPVIAVAAIVGDHQHYSIRVVDAQYTDYQMEVAPSKGDFPRTINPADVPYTYGEAYTTDAFFPAQNVGLYDPYILRDFRGQNMVVYPFAYNPISKTLRVYYNMTVEMYADGQQGENIIDRRSTTVTMDPEIKTMYERQFINFSEGLNKYTPMVETGDLLIICHDAFMSAMQPFVNWKKQIGRPTTMVGTSTAGTTTTAIQAYIQNQYNANPNLTHVLLVGDVGQIPGINFTAGSGWNGYSGKSDNMYGQVVGNDLYNDIIIGRFSAETEAHVTTQVNKVIHYERDINASDTWLTFGDGLGNNDGPGHFGEYDWQHIENIRQDLLTYNYTTVYQDYPGVSGYSSSATVLSQHINDGVSIINYCNHGSETSWALNNYSNSHVNALTNVNKLPIVWSVACLNGKYDYSQPCFGETWLRATSGNVNNPDPTQPTGAIGGMFSYISQPWQEPQYGQDEMVDVLTEQHADNIKRTLGGISFDGNMKILDQYGQNANAAKGTYLSWILYGDPTLTVRNAVPQNMNVTHASSMSTSATSFMVNATNGNGALATLTRNNEIMGSATINNGVANITFTAPGTTGTATLTVFGYNKITYTATINITGGGTQYYNVSVMANPTNGGTVSGDGAYQLGQSCTVTATPNAGYTFVNWMENGNVVSTNAVYTFNVTGNHYLTANFQAQPQNYTVSVSANPTNGGTVSGGGTYQQGQSCTVHATANTGYTFTNWTENGNVVSTNANYSFTVNSNRTLVANFQEIPCEAPSNLTASVAENTITLAWEASPTAVRYRIYRDDLCIANDITALTYTDTNLEFSHQYCYYVTSMCSNGTMSVPTDEVCATTENFDCEAPTNVTAEAINYTDIRINWSASPTAQSYKIYRNGTLVTSGYPYVGGYYDTELHFGEYCYTVVAECSYGDSEPSEEACAELTLCDPAGDFTAEYVYEDEDNYGVRLTWKLIASAFPEYFHLYKLNETNEYELIADIPPTGTAYSYFDDVETGTYSYMLTAEYQFGPEHCISEPVYASCEVTRLNETNATFAVYPNPTQGEVTLEGEGINHVRIVNAYGQTVYNAKVEGEQVRIDLSNVAKGIYMMHIEAEGGQTVRKIVVE